PPPRHPPFPYTTLFRSAAAIASRLIATPSKLASGTGLGVPARRTRHWTLDLGDVAGPRQVDLVVALNGAWTRSDHEDPVAERDRDRKSTRLNSSHRTIS